MNKSLNETIYLLRGYNRLLRPYRRQYAVVLLGIATQMVFYTFYPLIFKKVFDVVIPSRQLELLFMVVAEVLVLLVVCGLGAFFQTKYMAKTGEVISLQKTGRITFSFCTKPRRNPAREK
jgi:ABC-type bacteriocin/lantibiotic exporter with double-glycine peptidase domain